MPVTRLVPEEEATGKVRAVYDDIMATRGLARVPNYWKALAANPDYLEATWQNLKVVMRPGRLDRLTKEIIAVAVSATNGCEYCIRSHTDQLKELGLDDAAILEVMGVIDFFNGSNAVSSGLRVPYEPPVYAGRPAQPAGADG